MKKYGVVLVGCGHIGKEHIESIYFRDNVKIIAVVDTNVTKAKLFAKKYNAEFYGTDYKEFVGLPQTDIVIITSNVSSHLEIFKYCVACGKHILCEKPIACNLKDGEEFYNIAKNCKSKVLIAHILRLNKSYCKIVEMINSGAIGKLQLIKIVQNHHIVDFERYKGLLYDCSPIVDCGVHYFDLVHWMTDSKICKVSGIGKKLSPDIMHDNYQMVHFETANGCIGSYEVAWGVNTPFKNVKEFIGEKGYISLTLSLNRTENREEGDLVTYYNSETGEYTNINIASEYRDMYAQFSCLINMIENNSEPIITLEEVFESFNVALKAEEAITKGVIIKF